MLRTFTIRSRGLLRAVVSTRSTKRDRPLEVTVGVRDDAKLGAGFLADHVTGARRRARGGHRVAVPTSAIKRTGTGKIPKGKRPRNVLRKPKGFLEEDRRPPVIGERRGRGGRGKPSILFTLHDFVRIREVWAFERISRRAFDKRFPEAFRAEFLKAITTRRRP